MSYTVFTTRSYQYMGDTLCQKNEYHPGQLNISVFPEGERHIQFGQKIKETDAILIGGTINESDTLELYDIASGLVDYGCSNLTIYVPYFGYSTQERAIHKGDVVIAKGRAILLSSIRSARLNNNIVLLDLHTPGIAHYFEGSLHCRHLSAKKIVLKIVDGLGEKKDVVVACTDAGRAKWVEGIANEAGTEAAFVYKRRLSATKTAVSGINADVKGKHVALYDDMIRSGGSFIKAAEAYNNAGAASITGIASHCVFHDDTLSKLKKSGLFKSVHLTNSHPLALKATLEDKGDGFIKVHDVVDLFAKHLE